MTTKFLVLLIIQLLGLCAFLHAQSIPTTNASQTCEDCVPPGWSIETGQTQISSKDAMGGFEFWSPPIAQPPSTIGSGTSNFLSLLKTTEWQIQAPAKAYTYISGLTPGQMYKLKYYVIAPHTTVFANTGAVIYTKLVDIVNGERSISFTDDILQIDYVDDFPFDQWIMQEISFVPNTSSVRLNVSGPGDKNRPVGIDVADDAVKLCDAKQQRIIYSTHYLTNNPFSTTIDLNDSNPHASFESQPTLSVVWFNNPTHSGEKIVDAASVAISGLYYAFLFDEFNNCYNTDHARDSVKVEICNAKVGSVPLNKASLTNTCPATYLDLNTTVSGNAPAGSKLVWFDNPTHSGSKIWEPHKVAKAGLYYAFYYDDVNNCYNTDNSSSVVSVFIQGCSIGSCFEGGTEQVLLNSPFASNVCPAYEIYPSDLLAVDLLNTGITVEWWNNPTRSGDPSINKITGGFTYSGTYYAFYTSFTRKCYTTNNSTSSVSVTLNPCPPCNAGIEQVFLGATSLTNVAACGAVNLNSLANYIQPPGTDLVWFNNSSHDGDKIEQPQELSTTGTYFAFFYDQINNCYNTDNSTSSVAVTITKTEVPLLTDTKSMNCPESTINLNKTLDGLPPANTLLHWFDNAAHDGEKIETPATVKNGTYYAFFYNSDNACYNTENSISKITVAPPASVTLSQRTIETVCPVTTVNLNDFVTGEDPVGGILKWFTDPNHNDATEVASPTNAPAGEYYAFYSFATCYNTNLSTSKLTVASPNCVNVSQVNVKLILEGALSESGTTMRNDLQKHYHGVALLPTVDPWGSGVQYGDIGNVNGSNGQIVDWIKLEIRKGADPTVVLESKSLLLKTNGSLVHVDGSIPQFNSQAEPVHIVIFHRNHLAVMSNPVTLTGAGIVNYDFTTTLSQAFNDNPSIHPPQLVVKNGVYCLWAGDVNQDLIVDVLDIPKLNAHVKSALNGVLDNADLNLDGKVDTSDAELFNKNFKQDINFTLYHN